MKAQYQHHRWRIITFHMSHQALPTTATTARRDISIVKNATTPSLTDIIQHCKLDLKLNSIK